jgi:hypothetical protein
MLRLTVGRLLAYVGGVCEKYGHRALHYRAKNRAESTACVDVRGGAYAGFGAQRLRRHISCNSGGQHRDTNGGADGYQPAYHTSIARPVREQFFGSNPRGSRAYQRFFPCPCVHTSASHAVTPTDMQALPGKPARLLRGEKHYHVGDILGQANAPQGTVGRDDRLQIRPYPSRLNRSR